MSRARPITAAIAITTVSPGTHRGGRRAPASRIPRYSGTTAAESGPAPAPALPSGRGGAAQHGRSLRYFDGRAGPARVDLLLRRGEQQVGAFRRGQCDVAFLVAGIAREVLARAELGRIDEDAHDHHVAFGPGTPDQAE